MSVLIKKVIRILILLGIVLCISSCSGGYQSQPYNYEKIYNYDAGQDIENALEKLRSNTEGSAVISEVKTVEKVITLTFDGMQDYETTDKILKLLDEYNMKATFFLPGIKSAEDPDTVLNILKHGQQIENYTLSADKYMERESKEELVESFCRTGNILETITGKKPTTLKCNVTNYTKDLLQAANASGLTKAVSSNIFLNAQSFKNYDEANDYIGALPRGSIISVKVDSALDSSEYKTDIAPISATPVPSAPQNSSAPIPTDALVTRTSPEGNDNLISVITMLLKALNTNNYTLVPIEEISSYEDIDYEKDFVKERVKNAGKLSETLANGFLTKAVAALNFSNIKGDKIYDILDLLDKYKIKATFFVTGQEALEENKKITEIKKRGHLIENGGLTGVITADMDFRNISFEIYKGGKLLKEKYNIESHFYMPPKGNVNEIILEAASSLGYTVAAYNKNPVTDTSKSVDEIMKYFKNGFHRGDITYLNLGLYENVTTLTERIILQVKAQDFGVQSLDKIFNNQYARRELDQIPGYDAISISNNKSAGNISNRVINKVPTNEKKVFLTFDDWGSDKTVDNILNILDRYQVLASFFVRANGVEANPNLLKAIEEKGHDIANHSYAHNIVTKITTQELKEDIVKGHEIITKAINRQPELFFRPPTLEFDNSAIKAILNVGFHYVILGDISTHDYEASYDEVVDYVMKNAAKGSIIVLHMSDNSSAGKALPLIIEKLRKKGYEFAKLSDYLK